MSCQQNRPLTAPVRFMKEKWVVLAKKADFYAIGEEFGIDPVVARIIRNRDIIGADAVREYLYGGLECLKDPFALRDMDTAVSILRGKIEEKKRIRIIGDYDADGIMASYILKMGLEGLGAVCDIRIPNRIADGYGLNTAMIEAARTDGIDTVLTCDNGIAAHDAVKLAKASDMTVVVTDHHEVLELPPADAVVDPKRSDDTSESGNLCGAAIAWKLIRAMGGDDSCELLQYAAFATICDIMELREENRIIVKEGLRRMRQTENIGLRALAEECSLNLRALNSWHIGFVLGPCLNASGRLDTAMKALSLLFSSSPAAAKKCAEELRALNESRKAMTEEGVKEASRLIEEEGLLRDKVLVVFLPSVHESIAGIIAGRIRERYARPVFILTRGEKGIKGSGRSTEQYSMFEELVKAEDLLTKYGGHPMAAGLSLEEDNIKPLRERLNRNTTLTDDDLIPKIRIDVPMPIGYVSEKLIRQLELLEPFGKGNEKPAFAQKHVFCDHVRIFGTRHNCLKARLRTADMIPGRPGSGPVSGYSEMDGISFRDVDALSQRIAENPELSIVYEPQINDYMGQRRIQIVITHFE